MNKICHIPYEQLKELIKKSLVYDFYSEQGLYIPQNNRWLELSSTKITDSYLPR